MNLLECDGKTLLARHGLKIPNGALWPRLPDHAGQLVVKAQIPSGRRGALGGILFADTPEQARAQAENLGRQRLGEHHVAAVYVEERLAIARELYLAVALDRDAGCQTVVSSPDGGMSIEEVSSARILKMPIDPLTGPHAFQLAEVARFLADGATDPQAFVPVVETLLRVARAEDTELVEINPLALLPDGRVLAADAKVVLDDNAAFRRSFEPEATLKAVSAQSALERTIGQAGAVGVEVDADGEVIAVVSGAGLMMATLDLLKTAGLRVRCVVDLGGSVLAGGEGLRRVFEAVATASPKVTFLNAFMQTALCDEFARMLAGAQEASPLAGRVVVRLKGRCADTGREILKRQGFEVFEDLAPALDALTAQTNVREGR